MIRGFATSGPKHMRGWAIRELEKWGIDWREKKPDPAKILATEPGPACEVGSTDSGNSSLSGGNNQAMLGEANITPKHGLN